MRNQVKELKDDFFNNPAFYPKAKSKIVRLQGLNYIHDFSKIF